MFKIVETLKTNWRSGLIGFAIISLLIFCAAPADAQGKGGSTGGMDGFEALRSCLNVEDQTKERLDCYDDKIKPEPKQISAPSKTVQDCRFLKEEDERLNCFNRFVNTSSKKNMAQQKLKKPVAGTTAPGPTKQ